MELGIYIHSLPEQAAADARAAEERGFEAVWCADLPTGIGDVFACMALAAAATSRITIGSAIASPTIRTPLGTANGAATVNALAPGRTVLGLGSGKVASAMAGSPPLAFEEVERHIATVRALLHEDEASVGAPGSEQTLQLFHRERQFIRTDPPPRIYVAAAGPRGARLVREYGEGMIGAGDPDPKPVAELHAHATRGRSARDPLPFVYQIAIMVLRDGEKLDSPRVIERLGAWIMSLIKASAAGSFPPEWLPPALHEPFEHYHAKIRSFPPAQQRRALLESQGILLAEEHRYITAEALETLSIVGERSAVVEKIAALEEAGITHLAVDTSYDRVTETLHEIADTLLGRI